MVFVFHANDHMRLLLLFALVALMTTPITAPHSAANPPNSAQSKEVQALNSERSSLKNQADLLENKRTFWKTGYSGLAITAIVGGGFLALLSWGAEHISSKNEDKAKPLLSRIAVIDQRLAAIDKEESDLKIEEAKERSEKLAADNIKLSAVLEKQVQTEASHAEELRRENLKTEGRLTDANRKLGEEETKRLELQKALAPRQLWLKWYDDKTSSIDDLKALGKVYVSIEYVQEAETERAARILMDLFKAAGWDVTTRPSNQLIADGVRVAHLRPNTTDVREQLRDEYTSTNIAEVVVSWLLDSGWNGVIPGTYSIKETLPSDISAHSICVFVGMRPSTFFGSIQVRRMEEEAERMTRESVANKSPQADAKGKKVTGVNIFNGDGTFSAFPVID